MELLKKHFGFTARLLLALTVLLTMALMFGCEDDPTEPGVVATPTFTPEPGIYDTPQTVAINCATRDAEIYYTLDGTTPDTTSTLYTEPILVNSNTTIKAIGFYSDYAPSAIATGEYRIRVSFTDGDDYVDYMESREWGILVSKAYSDGTTQQLLSIFDDWGPDDVTTSDTFTLTVNNVSYGLSVNDGVVETDVVSIPVPANATEMTVVFKRNGEVKFNGTVPITATPGDLVSPQNPDITAPFDISWTMPYNASMQICELEVWGNGGLDYDMYDKVVLPTARSYTFPANAVTLPSAPEDGTIYVYEGIVSEFANSAVVTISNAMRDLYGTSKFPKVRKLHNPFGNPNK